VIATIVDARKGEVFFALHRVDADGPRQVLAPTVGPISDVLFALAARGQRALAVGNGAWRYRDELAAQGEPSVDVVDLRHPPVAVLAQLARGRAISGDGLAAASELRLMYLRAPDAEINWSRR